MSVQFEIEIAKQGWLAGTAPEHDFCSHGDVRVTIGGELISAGDGTGDYGISEAALALLRTLSDDHTPERPVAERLIPHGCGAILMMGCPIGIDWSVSHAAGRVTIADVVRYEGTSAGEAVSFRGLAVAVRGDEYRDQVVAFARKAKEPFLDCDKVFADDFDRQQYVDFWDEYDRRLRDIEARDAI